ncbi:galectin 17 [Nematolebias whitei]|uniref:galectin 17 n=1 Tax=Nematolebias whitei TaxID=451745 RepID=UPI001899EBF8|nr:galectin 17 [Nematolebias whitei]
MDNSSALPPAAQPLSIMSTAGSQVVLPCSWKPHQAEVGPSSCHVQWVSPPFTVFEQNSEDKWQQERFDGRLEVPTVKLQAGDCSLIIKDAQIEDTGRYESFMVVGGARSMKTRVFIQSVKLSVTDNKSWDSHHPGEDFVLELHTRLSFTVVFQGRNNSAWQELWKRGDENSERVEKHPVLEQLTIKKLRRSDEGIYKVLNENGLSVSTVQLSVTENSPSFSAHRKQENVPTGEAAKSSCSALLIVSLLVLSFQIHRH